MRPRKLSHLPQPRIIASLINSLRRDKQYPAALPSSSGSPAQFVYNIIFFNRFTCRHLQPAMRDGDIKNDRPTGHWADEPSSRPMSVHVQSKLSGLKTSENLVFNCCVPAVDTDTQIKLHEKCQSVLLQPTWPRLQALGAWSGHRQHKSPLT